MTKHNRTRAPFAETWRGADRRKTRRAVRTFKRAWLDSAFD
jgi:hypothetical protein